MNDNCTNGCQYRVDAPYPPVRAEGPNRIILDEKRHLQSFSEMYQQV